LSGAGAFQRFLTASPRLFPPPTNPAPQWCGHCKKLTPEYAQAATELLANDPPLRIAKVDATANDAIAQRFKVQGFPTLKFFKGGADLEYNGGRTASEIVSWVQRKSGPAYTAITTVDEATAFKAKDTVTVFGFFSELEGDAFDAFATMAGGMDDVPCAVTTSAEVRAALEVEGTDNAVVLFKDFDEGVSKFDGDVTDSAAVSAFVGLERVALLTEFSPETAPKIFGGPIKTHVLIMADSKGEGFEAAKASWTEAAKGYRGEALFIWVPPSEDRILSFFEVTEADLPTAVVVKMPEDSGMKKFPFAGDANNGEELAAFVGTVVSGEVKPTLKSEEPEAADLEGPVAVIKGKSFDDIVLNNDKDVLVEFYAPWCGHCKALAPVYEELATKLSANEKLTIAKMDSTANEVEMEGLNIRGFPTIFFFPATTDGSPKTPMEFEGSRDVEGFTAFLAKHTTHKLVVPDAEAAEADEAKDEL